MNNPTILSQTLSNIDWSKIASEITTYAKFDTNKSIIEQNPKVYEFESLASHFSNLNELIKKIDEIGSLHEIFFSNLRDNQENHNALNYISKGGVATIDQLNFLANLIENLFPIKRTLNFGDYREILEDFINKTQRLKSKFINPFRKFVDADGSVHLEKHPIIAPLIQEQISLERRIRETINFLLKDEDISKRLQMDTFDIINERFVIPIRSDSYRSDLGSIVARSSTGNTLFVEPVSTRKMANELIEINSKIDYALSQICKGYSEQISNDIQVMKDIYSFYISLDYTNTLASYSHAKNFCYPEISADGETIITDFYHPLIDECVTNSIELESNHKGIIISGPNTGGKTVSIKSIVISHLFFKLGLFIPAQKAKLQYKTDIFYFDSDYQDLEMGLSSFAGEVKVILGMLENIQNNSLIAADEIFNSTSSDEASSLAYSIINYVTHELGCDVLISTHHQLLKTKMQDNPDFLSAHVGYDFEKNCPTYKLAMGTPGSSMALEIFKRLSHEHSIPTKILDNAKKMLDTKYVTYEKLLQDLSRKQEKIDKTLRENKQLNFELKNQKKSQEGILFLEKQRAFDNYEKEIRKIIKGLNDVKAKSLSNEITHLSKQFEKLKPDHDEKKAKEEVRTVAKEIKQGHRYFCDRLNTTCVVSEIKGKNCIVEVNGKKITVPKNSLFDQQGIDRNKKAKPKKEVQINVFKTINYTTEVNCRGMRLSEFQQKVFSCIDDLRMGHIPYLIIVHGHGDGTLKKWLRNEMRRHKDLTWTPDEGNDGATRIDLVNNN
ncbi:endonuclease MutS2 [Halobacteriovorax sp. DPLXC-1]|uniref:endonuclease MutS2 n=1 Tax=Halobacteriovorax sp. DPLXC-1 TaxID=3110771 RepID=UPI002FF382F0